MNENHNQLLRYCVDNNCIGLWNRVYYSVYPQIKASLSYANLRNVNLGDASLSGADLSDASLSGADLSGAFLIDANLRNVNLKGASLIDAYLSGADLSGASLRNADLEGADLRNAKLPNYQVCPEEGDFIAYKKFVDNIVGKVLCRGIRVCNLVSRKIRVEQIKPLIFYNTNEKSVYNGNWGDATRTKYTCNRWTKALNIDTDIRIDCAEGIHVFITRKEAEEW